MAHPAAEGRPVETVGDASDIKEQSRTSRSAASFFATPSGSAADAGPGGGTTEAAAAAAGVASACCVSDCVCSCSSSVTMRWLRASACHRWVVAPARQSPAGTGRTADSSRELPSALVIILYVVLPV
jgi:hypothetical protein